MLLYCRYIYVPQIMCSDSLSKAGGIILSKRDFTVRYTSQTYIYQILLFLFRKSNIYSLLTYRYIALFARN